MKRLAYALILAMAFAGAAAAAAQPPDSVRQAVQAGIDEAMAPDPEDAADPDIPPIPRAGAKMFKRVNINDDGVADWRIDFEQAPNPSYFCGTGGCRQQIFVSNAQGGFDLAMDTQVREFKLRHSRGQMLLDVDFHGSVCGGYGVNPCPRSYVWSAASARFMGRIGPDGQTFFVGGLTQLTTPPAASLPALVQAALADRTARCEAVGGTYAYEDAYLTEVDDLNADGRSDWVIGGEYDGCAFEETPDSPPVFDLAVLVSGPSGYAVAWRDASVSWGIDLTGAGARFVTLEGAEDCGLNGKDCQKTAWRWDGSALVKSPASQP